MLQYLMVPLLAGYRQWKFSGEVSRGIKILNQRDWVNR